GGLLRTLLLRRLAAISLLLFAASAGASPIEAEDPAKPALQERVGAINQRIADDFAHLESLYKHFHTHPELSLREAATSARLAKELRDLGFEVTEKVGGTGVVGVLRNGAGPTVLVRTDMDALPVVEQTGLPYASKVQARDKEGKEVGVMHACGHDMHMTCWIGTAGVLAGMKERWQGTLVFIGQPAEEIGAEAKTLLDDGLFKRFP